LPFLEAYYDLNYAVISFIFLSNAAGFIVSSFLSNKLHVMAGRCKSLIIGTALQASCYIILSTHPPYAAVVMGFFLAGAGMGFILAHANSYMVYTCRIKTDRRLRDQMRLKFWDICILVTVPEIVLGVDNRNWSDSGSDYRHFGFTEFNLVELLFHSIGIDADISRGYRSFVPERTF